MTDSRDWRESFHEDKFAAAVLYLLRGCSPVRPGLTSLLKMLWFADYEHYRQHLRTITGGEYVALPKGPVLDGYRELLDLLEGQELIQKREVPIQGQEYRKIEYTPLVEPDETLFTESELETLGEIVRDLGNLPGAALSRLTHRTGPWPLVYSSSERNRPIPRIMFRWLDNLPDEEDLEAAKHVLDRPDVAAQIAELTAR